MNKNIFINQGFTNKFLKTFSLKDLNPRQIKTICIFMILFGITEVLIMFFSKYLKSVLDKKIERDIMNTYFSKLLVLKIEKNEFENIRVSDLDTYENPF